MSGCYTWKAKCLAPSANPCQVAQGTCPETQAWFWILAGALGLGLLIANKGG